MDYWTKATLADGGSLAKSYCDMSGEPLIQGLIVGSESDRLSIAEMEQVRRHQAQEILVIDKQRLTR